MDSPSGGRAVREPQPKRGRLLVGLALLLGLACLFGIYRSPLFRLSTVEINGTNRLSDARVMALAGLSPGVLRFEHSPATIVQRLQADPWVASASAVWHGTNQLQIDLVERQPVGMIKYYDVHYLLLDDTGLILAEEDLKGGHLPVISGMQVTKAVRGQRLSNPGAMDALAVLSRMAPSLQAEVSEVSVDGDRSLTMYLNGGATVLWGEVPEGGDRTTVIEQKIKDFGGFWLTAQKKQSNTCRIDLRVDGKVIDSGCR
ncbi:MAG: cell division protein FtsQ/DivIB [Mycobacterium leprae]